MSQVPEESFTLAQYRNTFKKRFEFVEITVLGSDANGTHFQWDDARGERHFGVISDLLGQHRHSPASILTSLNQAGTLISTGAYQTVNTISFTPETQPFHVYAFWRFLINTITDFGLDANVAADWRLSGTGGIVDQMDAATVNIIGPATVLPVAFSLHGAIRRTSTAAFTMNAQAIVDTGVEADSYQIVSSRLVLMVIYERRILV